GRGQKADAVVAAQVVADRGDRAATIDEIGNRRTGSIEDAIAELDRPTLVVDGARKAGRGIAAESTVGNLQCAAIQDAADGGGRVAAHGAVGDRHGGEVMRAVDPDGASEAGSITAEGRIVQ